MAKGIDDDAGQERRHDADAAGVRRVNAHAETAGVLVLPQPYLLFVGDTRERGYAKTAFGLRDWAGDKCVGECASDPAAVTTGLPRMTPAEGAARGARALVIAVANKGGFIPLSWRATLIEALEAGLDFEAGGAVAETLARLYQGARRAVIDASVGWNPAPFLDVAANLEEIATAWRSLRSG